MKKSIQIIALFLLWTHILPAQNLTETGKTAAAIDLYLSSKFEDKKPGAAVLVISQGKTVLRKGYGLADLSSGAPNTPETIFRIGSVTKQFTSTAILKLAEEGKINIADDITVYLPNYPLNGKKVTVEHLLTHTSGIKSYTSLERAMTKEAKGNPVTVAAMIDVFKSEPFDFDPGDRYMYNNSGYFLLGAFVEKASGMPWGEYLKKNFFIPLKMKSTFYSDANMPVSATGYDRAEQTGFRIADYIHPDVPYAAGALFSTVDDLWKWNQAIFSYKVISKKSLDKAWTPVVLNDGSKQSYGYGWGLEKVNEKLAIAHGGGIDGFVCSVLYVPETRLFVAVLTNSTTFAVEDIAFDVADLASGVVAKAPVAITLDDKALSEYVGVYDIHAGETRAISKVGAQLFSQRSGGGRFEIYPFGKDDFFFKDSPSRLHFLRDEKGVITSVEMRSRDYYNQIAKKTDKPLPKEQATVTVPTEVFDTYVGQYQLAPEFVITVRREGDRFMTQATGQQAFEIFAESQTRFFLKVVDAQIEFNKDASGKVTGLTLFQGGRAAPAKRIDASAPPEKKRVAIALNPAVCALLEGEYALTPAFTITIYRATLPGGESTLMARATGQDGAEIFPESEYFYFYKVVDAQIKFQKDADGKISGLVLYQNGREVPGKKIK